MTLHIYDGMNYARTRLEDKGDSIRDIYDAMRRPVQGLTKMWVWEGKGSLNKRRAIFPEYKNNRKRRDHYEDIFASIKILRELLFCTDCYQIEIPGYEGDDVVANLVKHYKPHHNIVIMSNDKDFRQLYVEGHIVGFANKLMTGEMGKEKKKVEIPDWQTHLYKTLVGDPSDNVSGIPGFGAAKYLELKDVMGLIHRFSGGNFQITEADGFLPKHVEWAAQNADMLQRMWQITSFFDIPYDVLSQHCKVGQLNDEYANQLVGKYLLR